MIDGVRAVQYARSSDGTKIAWLSVGSGPAIVFASNIFGDAHLYRHGWPHVRSVTDRLVDLGWMVVRYDVRGMGASDRDVADLRIDAMVDDLGAVVDAAGLALFSLAGVDAGAPVAVAYAVARPSSVSRLVLVSPWSSGAERFTIPEARKAHASVPTDQHDWALFKKVLAAIVTGFDGNERLRALLIAVIEDAVSPRGLAAYYEAVAAFDVSGLLAQLRTPTLVLHEASFPFGTFELCRDVAANVNGAEFVVIDGPAIAGDEQEAHVTAIDSFARDGRTTVSSAAGAASIPTQPAKLTGREVAVLALVATGASNKEIARSLGIAVGTVERHLVNAYVKIGARGRADATAYALRHGLR